METPEVGDRVVIGSVRMCELQMQAHGFHTFVDGLEGVIIAEFEGAPLEHPWKVDFGQNLSPEGTTPLTWQYFAASELELVADRAGG